MTRIIRYIIVCLVLGSVSTILAAQICAAWLPVWDSDLITEGVTAQQGRAWRVAIYQRTGATYIRARAIWDVALYRHGRFANADRVLDPTMYEAVEMLRDPPDPALPFDSRYVVTERGWPFPALRGTQALSPVNGVAAPRRGSKLAPIDLPDSQLILTASPMVDDDFTALPLHPIWKGFALDTALYAVTWAITLSIVVPVWRTLGRKRIMWRAATAVVLGGLTTVAVAWTCAVWTDLGTGRAWTEVYRAAGTSDRFVFVQQFVALGAARSEQQDEPLGNLGRSLLGTGIQSRGFSPGGTRPVTVVDARGWPFQALRCQFDAAVNRRSGRGTIERIEYGMPLESTASSAAGPLRDAKVLPLRPISAGFAADTLFYGGAWFALLIVGAVPMWLRTVSRRRRGECEQCGYDLRGHSGGGGGGGGMCPECGATTR